MFVCPFFPPYSQHFLKGFFKSGFSDLSDLSDFSCPLKTIVEPDTKNIMSSQPNISALKIFFIEVLVLYIKYPTFLGLRAQTLLSEFKKIKSNLTDTIDAGNIRKSLLKSLYKTI